MYDSTKVTHTPAHIFQINIAAEHSIFPLRFPVSVYNPALKVSLSAISQYKSDDVP